MALTAELQAKRFQRPAWSHEPSIWDAWLEQHGGFEPRQAWPAPTYEYFWPYPFPAPNVPGLPSPSAKLGDPEGSARAIEDAIARGEVVRRSPLALPEQAGGANPFTELALPGLVGAAAGAGTTMAAERLFGSGTGAGAPSSGGGPSPSGLGPTGLTSPSGLGPETTTADIIAESARLPESALGLERLTTPFEGLKETGIPTLKTGASAVPPWGGSPISLWDQPVTTADIISESARIPESATWGEMPSLLDSGLLEEGAGGASSTIGNVLSTAAIGKGIYDITQGDVGPGLTSATIGGTGLLLPTLGVSSGWAGLGALPLLIHSLGNLFGRGGMGTRGRRGPPIEAAGEQIPGLRRAEALIGGISPYMGVGGPGPLTETVGGRVEQHPIAGSVIQGGELRPIGGTGSLVAQIARALSTPIPAFYEGGESAFQPTETPEMRSLAAALPTLSPEANPYVQAILAREAEERRRADEMRFASA